MARALIARVKAADSSIDRRDELWYASDSDALDRRVWHVRQFAPADSLRMGDGPVTEWVARLEKPEQAYTAAVLRNDALRLVLEWLRSELPWCLTWAPVLGSLHGVRREVASKRSRGASGHFAPSAVAASAAVVAQPAAAIAVSATAVSVATTTAVAEPAAAAAVTDAAFAVSVAPPRRAEVEKASPPATLVVSLAERPRLHDLIPRDDACRRAIGAENRRSALRLCAHMVCIHVCISDSEELFCN